MMTMCSAWLFFIPRTFLIKINTWFCTLAPRPLEVLSPQPGAGAGAGGSGKGELGDEDEAWALEAAPWAALSEGVGRPWAGGARALWKFPEVSPAGKGEALFLSTALQPPR